MLNNLSILKITLSSILGLILSLWSPALKANNIESFLTDSSSQYEIASDKSEVDWFNSRNVGKAYQYKSTSSREIPTTYHDAIVDHDIPIELIQQLNKLSFDHWNNKVFNDEEKTLQKTFNIDLNTLKESNIKAFAFWNHLVVCNQNNANKARVHFMMLIDDTGLCENGNSEIDDAKSKELLAELKVIKTNFQRFYKEISLKFYDSLKDSNSYNLSFELFQNLHPVLVQFLVMQWSVFAYSPMEQFEMNGLGYAFNLEKKYIYDLKSQFDKTMSNAEKMNLEWSQNSEAILVLINFKNFGYPCGTFGLWPILNYALFEQDNLRTQIAKKAFTPTTACSTELGSSMLLFSDPQFFYNSAWLFHRKQMQELNSKLSEWDK